MNDSLAEHYLADALQTFRDYKALAEKAMAQVVDEEFLLAIDKESNSIGVIVKHMAGNMLSRWTDFLSTDGEKPSRHRDMEFVITEGTTRAELTAYWERGWACVFAALEPLRVEDFNRKVLIRGEEHTIIQAINRQLTHYAYHTGQIVFLAKHLRSVEWKSLSIPRNRSAEFNTYLEEHNRRADDHEARGRRFSSSLDFIRESESKKS
ncbi:MAG TPA: DUF1572 family protein [Pyrinomonadaceae bacterium]|jgi:hypothetical protein